MRVLSQYRVVEGGPLPALPAKSFLEILDETFRDAETNFLKESDMVIHIGDESGTHKVISADALEHETRAGWRLVRVITCDGPIRYMVKPAEQGTQANNWQHSFDQYAEEVGTVTRFLVAKGRATEAAELDEQIAALRAEKNTAEERCVVLTKDSEKMADTLGKTEKALDSEKALTTRLRTDLAEQATRLAEQATRFRKMEADVAKLRTAIGALGMKEILGG